MPYYKCMDCKSIFDKLKSNDDLIGVCPKCNTRNHREIEVKEMKIVIFDDQINCDELTSQGKPLPCKYKAKFTSDKESHIVRTETGYEMVFHISDFLETDPVDLIRYMAQFIQDCYSHSYRVIFKLVNEMTDQCAINDYSQRLKNQIDLLSIFIPIDSKMIVGYGLRESVGLKSIA